MIWTLAFWKGATERAIKTFAATLASLLTGNGIGLIDVDWGQALSVSGLATLVSFLIAIGNAEFTAGKEPKHKSIGVSTEVNVTGVENPEALAAQIVSDSNRLRG